MPETWWTPLGTGAEGLRTASVERVGAWVLVFVGAMTHGTAGIKAIFGFLDLDEIGRS